MIDIKPLKQYIFIKVDKTHADTITSEGGLKLMLIMGWEPGDDMWHVRESGEVVAGPTSLYKEFETTMDVLPGDKVYFHFHVVCEDNRIEVDGEEYYLCQYDLAYLVIRDGKMIMLNNYILAKPKMEEQEDCFSKSGIQLRSDIDPIPVKNRAIVTHMPSYAEWPQKGLAQIIPEMESKQRSGGLKIADINEMIRVMDNTPSYEDRMAENKVGFSIGDEIHYAPESDIPFKVEGEIYYRMQIKDVWGKVEEGKLKPLQDYMLVRPKEDVKKSPAGVILSPIVISKKYGEGEVVKVSNGPDDRYPMVVKEGENVLYNKGIPIVLDGDSLHWVREKYVMGILS